MKEIPLDKKKWENWLNANNDNLIKISECLFHRMRSRKLNLSSLAYPLFEVEDVYQEMFAISLEEPEKIVELFKKPVKSQKCLENFFWQRILDKSRKKEGNQDIYKDEWRLFYRHITDVLGKSPVFVKKRREFHLITFSLTDQEAQDSFEEEMLDIPYPAETPFNFEQINNAKHIEKLAFYFWKRSADITRKPNICISVMDFITWITKYVCIGSHVQREADRIDSDGNISFSLESYPANYEYMEEIKAKRLTAYAQNFFHSLDETEKSVLYYYECMGLTHKEVSEKMNKKSNMSYRRDLIREKLKHILRPLDDVSPGIDQNFLAFDVFMEHLCASLSQFHGEICN